MQDVAPDAASQVVARTWEVDAHEGPVAVTTGRVPGGLAGEKYHGAIPLGGGDEIVPFLWRPLWIAQDVRIGYAIARTGPWAAGAQVTQEPNYVMWAPGLPARTGPGRTVTPCSSFRWSG